MVHRVDIFPRDDVGSGQTCNSLKVCPGVTFSFGSSVA